MTGGEVIPRPPWLLEKQDRESPGGPVVVTPHFHCRGPGVQSLVGELGSLKPGGQKKKARPVHFEAYQEAPDSIIPGSCASLFSSSPGGIIKPICGLPWWRRG